MGSWTFRPLGVSLIKILKVCSITHIPSNSRETVRFSVMLTVFRFLYLMIENYSDHPLHITSMRLKDLIQRFEVVWLTWCVQSTGRVDFRRTEFWTILRFPALTPAWYVLSRLSGSLFHPLTPGKVDRVQYRIVHLTTGIYEGQTLKPSGVKLREEVLRATAEKNVDLEQVSRRRQHDAHNDPLLSLPKSIPDTQLLILSSGSYDFSGLTRITKFHCMMI